LGKRRQDQSTTGTCSLVAGQALCPQAPSVSYNQVTHHNALILPHSGSHLQYEVDNNFIPDGGPFCSYHKLHQCLTLLILNLQTEKSILWILTICAAIAKTALQGALVLAKSWRLELGDNILRTL